MDTPPLQDLLTRLGASYGPWQGTDAPARFGDPAAEHAAITEAAGLADLSSFPRYHLTGRDRVRYLHGMITNDVEKLAPGQGRYAALMTANGRTLSDLWVFAFEEHLALVLPPGSRERVMQHLDFYLIADKAEFEDVTAARALLSVQGPTAAEVIRAAGLPAPEEALSFAPGQLAGRPATVFAVDRCGLGGFDVEVAAEDAPAAWEALEAAGATPAGFEALNVARVEAGIPWTGWELTDKVIPMEAALTETAISFKKGCFIGQEVLAKIKYRGKINRLLVSLTLPEGVAEGDRLFFEGRDMGWVTSAVDSPSRGRIGLGMLHRKAVEGPGPVTVGEGERAQEVGARPLAE